MTLLRPTVRKPPTVAPGDGRPHPGRQMTEREFVEWADDRTRAEWVDGEVIVMPPDSSENDDAGFWARSVLQDFVEHFDLGRVKGPNFTVRLGRQRRRRVPDVLFVAKDRQAIILENHVEGPPDLIIEVTAPESFTRDWRDKYIDYERAGVREYWVIDRQTGRIEAYALDKTGRYRRIEEKDGKVVSTVLRGFYLRPKWLLGPTLPSRRAAMKEMGVKA